MLLLARRLCDVLGLVSPLRGGTRSRAVVTLCTVRVKGRRRLRCWAALRSPFLTATWHATCQVWRSATHSLWRAPCVAAVALLRELNCVGVECVGCELQAPPPPSARFRGGGGQLSARTAVPPRDRNYHEFSFQRKKVELNGARAFVISLVKTCS